MSRQIISPLNRRWACACCVVLSLTLGSAVVSAQNDPPKPADPPKTAAAEQALKKIEDMPIPTVEELLTKPPVDWVVLRPPRRDEVLVIQPVSPRPDTILRMNKAADELRQAAKRPKQEAGESADQYRQRMRDLMDEAENLLVLFPLIEGVKAEDQDANEYRLNVAKNIDRIIYHEDLMLKRADLLMNEGKLSQAFELLLVLERRAGEWPGYVDRRNRLLYEEGQKQKAAGNVEAAYGYFEELHASAPKYDGLQDALGASADALIQGAMDKDQSMQARFYLSRLRQKEPAHRISVKWTDFFVKQVDVFLEKSRAAREQGRHSEALELVEQGARVWPAHPLLKSVHRLVANRHQTLHVGVSRFPGDPTPFPMQTDADARTTDLRAVELFEIARVERTPLYQSRYIEEWTPTDLGRQVVFQLKPRRSIWEASPLVSATQVVQGLGERLRPESPYFDERLKSYVRSATVKSPYEFVVNLSRIPVRPQAIFRFPVIATEPDPSSTGDSKGQIVSQRFSITSRTDDRIVYRREVLEPDTSPQFHVAEVVEHKYANTEQQIQALMRGDITLLPKPPIWLVDRIARAEMFSIEPYAMPTSHVLQFNSRSDVLKNNEIRRALAYSLNRERVLKEIVFREEKINRGRITTAPFSSKSYAYNPEVQPHAQDLPLAFALVSVGKKKFGGKVPELTMVCEPDDVSIRCCEEFIKDWARVGVTVKLVTDPATPSPENWDIVYRSVRMAEPLTELWPFLTITPNARIRELEHLPDWLRQSLVELDQSADMATATDQLRRLHLKLHDFVQFVPLWEIDDVVVFRKHIQGVPQTPLGPYHNIERWIIQPWYPTELLGEST